MSDRNKNQTQDPAPPPGTEVHVYDGIVEHDNFLPRWWLAILYGSMIFGLGYLLYYNFGPGPSLVEEYQSDIAKRMAQTAASPVQPEAGVGDDASLKEWATSAEHLAQGKGVFTAKCAVCHGQAGEGGIGPNMTDDYWIHGVKPTQVATTISGGILDKGMPAWGALLSNDELKSVTGYIRSLHGTNPPNAKAPQGTQVAFE